VLVWCVWRRKVSRYCENYLRNMASTMLVGLEKTVNIQEEKFTGFEVRHGGRGISTCSSLPTQPDPT